LKYHTTAKDIAVSVLVVLSCATICLYALVTFDLGNPAQPIANRLIGRLDRGGELSVSVEAIGREFFRNLELHDVTIEDGEGVGLFSETVVVSRSVQSLVRSLFGGSQTVSLDLQGPKVSVDRLPDLSPTGENGSSLLAGWLSRTSFEISSADLTAEVRLSDIQADFDTPSLSAGLGPSLSFRYLSWKDGDLSLSYDDGTVQADGVDISLDGSHHLQLQARSGSTFVQGASILLSNLKVTSDLPPSFDLKNSQTVFDISLESLYASREGATLYAPKFSGKATLDDLELSLAEASFASMDLAYENWRATLPTSSLSAKFGDPSLLVGFATKDESRTVFSGPGFEPVSIDSLQASAEFQEEGDQFARISSAGISTGLDGWDFALGPMQVSASAHLADDRYDTVDLSLETDVLADWPTGNLRFESPLSFEGRLSDDFGKISGTLDLDSLQTNLADGQFAVSVGYQDDFGLRQVQTNVAYDDQLSVSGLYDVPESGLGTFSVDARLDRLDVSSFAQAIETYASFLQPYVSEESTVTGNLSFQSMQGSGKIVGFDGTLVGDLAFVGLSVGNRTLNAGSTLSARLVSDTMEIDSLTMTTSGYRMLFAGNTEIGIWLPSGNLELSKVADGSDLLLVDFFPLPSSQYGYAITSPLSSSFKLEGTLERTEAGDLLSDATLALGNVSYPLDASFSPDTLDFTFESQDHLSVAASFVPPVSVKIVSEDLSLPDTGVLQESKLTGDLSFSVNDLHDWKVFSDSFALDSLSLFGNSYSFSGSLEATPSSIEIDRLAMQGENDRYEGSVSYEGEDIVDNLSARFANPFVFRLTFDDGDEKKSEIALSNEGDRTKGIARIESFELGKIFPGTGNLLLDASLVGFTDFTEKLDMDGSLHIAGTDNAGNVLEMDTDIVARDSLLTLKNASLSWGESSVRDYSLTIDTLGGLLSLGGRFESVRHVAYTDQQTHFDFLLSLGFDPVASVFDIPEAIEALPDERWDATLSIADLMVFGEKGLSDGTYSLSFKDGNLTARSELLSFSYDFGTKEIFASVDKRFGLGFDLEGTFGKESIYLDARNIFIPLQLLNRTFPKPILTFTEGNIEGQLVIQGPPSAPKTYGQLFADNIKMSLFWLPNDIISAKNVTASFDGDRGTTPYFPFFSVNTMTGQIAKGTGKTSLYLDGLSIASYQIESATDEGSVFVWLPLLDIDADMKAFASGDLEISGTSEETMLTGDVRIDNATMGFGIKGLPDWYVPTHTTSSELNLTTGRNVSLYYPNALNPIIKTTLNENQKLSFSYDHKNNRFDVDGVFNFRSGEIYYFQKNFFITEGSFTLHTDALSATGGFEPKINLRAKMSDFDQDGDRVDIYLVLRDSTLTNLNPTFESIPSKDVNEILEILGQSILPTGAYGQVNLSSVASLAVAATDVAERLGLIQQNTGTADLTDTIRNSLGLDMFSLRTNIVQNILIEAIPGYAYSSSSSPLARYLNNTSMFMGKYVGDNFFLQALLHLSAMDSSEVTRSFLVSDLSLDLELSLEWDNPLSTFSLFTQPNELSVYDILDTIGFSVTRRIILR
jgi:hypothetical protein